MSLKDTKDLSLFFSEENLKFLKNIGQETSKVDTLIEENQSKEEKFSLFQTALITKDFSNTNKDYFLDVKRVSELLSKNKESLKKLKNLLSNLSSKLLSLVLNDEDSTTDLVNEINSILNEYIDLVYDVRKELVTNNLSINTFTSYHSTRLLLQTFEMDLGEKLKEEIMLQSPNTTTGKIETAYSDIIGTRENNVLIISEKEKKVYLPYKRTELKDYLSQYPSSYYSYKNVIEKEFILPLNYFMNNPSLARFRETYSLYRDREATSPIEALQKALSLAFKSELNPAIIAACKTKTQLNNYLLCLEENKLSDFQDFEILYDMNPRKLSNK